MPFWLCPHPVELKWDCRQGHIPDKMACVITLSFACSWLVVGDLRPDAATPQSRFSYLLEASVSSSVQRPFRSNTVWWGKAWDNSVTDEKSPSRVLDKPLVIVSESRPLCVLGKEYRFGVKKLCVLTPAPLLPTWITDSAPLILFPPPWHEDRGSAHLMKRGGGLTDVQAQGMACSRGSVHRCFLSLNQQLQITCFLSPPAFQASVVGPQCKKTTRKYLSVFRTGIKVVFMSP